MSRSIVLPICGLRRRSATTCRFDVFRHVSSSDADVIFQMARQMLMPATGLRRFVCLAWLPGHRSRTWSLLMIYHINNSRTKHKHTRAVRYAHYYWLLVGLSVSEPASLCCSDSSSSRRSSLVFEIVQWCLLAIIDHVQRYFVAIVDQVLW